MKKMYFPYFIFTVKYSIDREEFSKNHYKIDTTNLFYLDQNKMHT